MEAKKKHIFLSRLCFIAGAAETKDSPSSYAMIRMLGAHLQTTTNSLSPSNFMHHQQLHDSGMQLHQHQQQQHQHPQLLVGNGGGNNGVGPQCPHCGKIYSNSSNLRQHVRNVHVSIDKSQWHACPTCAKKLKTKHYLINHQLQAHGIHQRGA